MIVKAIIVDDELFSAEYLESVCMELRELEIEAVFNNAFDALAYLRSNRCDLIFMDIEMPGLNGLQAVEEIRKILPDIGIIFVTGYEQYALDAFRADAVSYLLKPCCAEEVGHAVEKARRLCPPPSQKRVRVQTFGLFSVFIDEAPFHFSNGKAKELLALLIDRRGASVSIEQAVGYLWEDRPYDDTVKQLYRKAVIYLNQIMREKSLDFFVSARGSCHIVPSKLDCDYYRLLDGDAQMLRLYNGEYLSDYSWAEDTNGQLNRFTQSGLRQ